MSANSEIILSNQTHPGDSTSQSVIGTNFRGDGYYSRTDGFHTVQYTVTGFIGTISMQATLATNPSSEDWFTVSTSIHTSTQTDSAEGSGSFIKNFIGNYVWLRVIVSNWTDGTVNSILLNH